MGVDIWLYEARKPRGMREGERIKEEALGRMPQDIRTFSMEEWKGMPRSARIAGTRIVLGQQAYSPRKIAMYAGLIGERSKKSLEMDMLSFSGGWMKCGIWEEKGPERKLLGEVEVPRHDYHKVLEDVWGDVMAVELEEMCYQRGGIDQAGKDIMKNGYCGSRKRAEELCRHGLDRKFLDSWVPNKSLLSIWY